MSEVVYLDVVTSLDVPVERILSAAAEADLETAIVIGLDKDGAFYFASSEGDGAAVLWWIEIAKKRLLEIGDTH